MLTAAAIMMLCTPPRTDAGPGPEGSTGVSSVGEPAWVVRRVGGDMEASVERTEAGFRAGTSEIDTPLPEGYPDPTPPGAIEIKRYPSVRRAEVSGRVLADLGMNSGFWPLFRHIERRGIEMTSPVEMDYHDMMPSTDGGGAALREKIGAARGEGSGGSGEGGSKSAQAGGVEASGVPMTDWTMSFLYRRAEQGATGQDGSVTIRDTEPVTVVSLGMRGPYREARVREGVEKLRAWLAGQSEWEAVPGAAPRAFMYNGPGVPQRDLWSEAQLPIRRVAERREGAGAEGE